MINVENNMTAGHNNKRKLKAMLNNYILDRKTGEKWSIHEVQKLQGKIAYFYQIDKTVINIINAANKKHSVNVTSMIKEDLSRAF